ncbi:MAG: metallophosphoesterase [Lentisphaeria bacterium]|nr:metallophosphoesterase [Lentisphaeria bacterium]
MIIRGHRPWILCLGLFLACSLGADKPASGKAKGTRLAYPDAFRPNQRLFRFVQVTDTHLIAGENATSVRKGIHDINMLDPQPAFVVITGDIINGEKPLASTELARDLFAGLRCPVIPVYGNHDHLTSFEEVFGRRNDGFNLPPYHFLVLDTVRRGVKDTYDCGFSEETLSWLAEHVQTLTRDTPIIVLGHASVYREPSYTKRLPGDVDGYEKALAILNPYKVVAWFGGHAHSNAHVRKEGVDHFTTGCLSDERRNNNCPLGYRIVDVHADRVETRFRSIDAFRRRLVVAQDDTGDFQGNTEQPILSALHSLGKDGGTVFIKAGTYMVRQTISLSQRQNLRIEGEPGTILQLPPPTRVAATAPKGATRLQIEDGTPFLAGTTVRIDPPKTLESGHGEKGFDATVADVTGNLLQLATPLTQETPVGSTIGYANNIFTMTHSGKNILLQGLILDGGRGPNTPRAPGHVKRCAILVHGRFSYSKGPVAPPIEDFRVINCRIRNCYGRAVAMYCVARGLVEGCQIENIADEAIDLDHFCTHCEVRGNEVRKAHTGVTINDGSYCTVAHNRISECGVGITVWWWRNCPQQDIDIGNHIIGNVIHAPGRNAISLGKRCFWNEVRNNLVSGNISVTESRNVVEGNRTLPAE